MIKAAKILYIEDNRDDAYAAIRIFQNSYINLHCVHTCELAFEALKDGHYDLIICDLMLPGEDGLFFAKKLTASDINTPFILTSGSHSLRNFDNYHGLKNYLGFITKPITPEKVEELFNQMTVWKITNEYACQS